MLIICDRKVKIATGRKTQTVNICTKNNTFGEYEYIVRIVPPYLPLEQELGSKSFSSVEDFFIYVHSHYKGTIEKRSRMRTIGRAAGGNGDSLPNKMTNSSFLEWREQWKELMEYSGPNLPDPDVRINKVLDIWNVSVPDGWERGHDPQLLGSRYRRGDIGKPHAGEHTIEHDILVKYFGRVDFLGHEVIDGINAMPLAQDVGGGRQGNVEADLLLLLKKNGRYAITICEVKNTSNNPWYAIVENILQLKLLQLSSSARDLFKKRNPSLLLSTEITIMGCVVAPGDFYNHTGQKANARPHAERLIKQFCTLTGLPACLAVWGIPGTPHLILAEFREFPNSRSANSGIP